MRFLDILHIFAYLMIFSYVFSLSTPKMSVGFNQPYIVYLSLVIIFSGDDELVMYRQVSRVILKQLIRLRLY